MNAYESINYEVEFYMNNSCMPIEEEITSTMLDERNHDAVHHVPIEEVIMCKLMMWW